MRTRILAIAACSLLCGCATAVVRPDSEMVHVVGQAKVTICRAAQTPTGQLCNEYAGGMMSSTAGSVLSAMVAAVATWASAGAPGL